MVCMCMRKRTFYETLLLLYVSHTSIHFVTQPLNLEQFALRFSQSPSTLPEKLEIGVMMKRTRRRRSPGVGF